MQSNSVNGQPDIANITVVTDERQVIVPQPITSVVEVNNPGPQGPVGPQGDSIFTNVSGSTWSTTSSIQVTGSFTVSGSSTFTNIGPAIFSGSTAISGSLTANGYNVVTTNQTSSLTVSSASYADTSSFLNTLNQDLTFNGNLTLNGTASISTLVVNQTVLSTGSNQLGDAPNDTQTLYGTVVIPTGSLTVSGSAKVNEGIFGIGTSGTILPLVNTAGTGTVVVGGTSPNTPSLRLQGSPLNFFIGSTQVAQMFATTGNFTLQNGGTFTDAGFRLDVSGSARVTGEANVSFLSLSGNTAVNSSGTTLILGASGGWTGVRVPRYFETTGSISAASAIARGTYLNQTLVATANNDVLVGLDIQPTFTNGAFTGVQNVAIQLNSNANIKANGFINAYNINLNTSSTTLNGAGGGINFQIFTGNVGRFFSTGNLLLQNGGTFTDSGARLHISGSTSEALLVASSSAGPALYVSGSGQVGIGTSTPSSSISLDVSGSIRSFNILPAANGSYDLGVSANRFRNGWFAGSLIAGSGYFSDLLFGTTNLRIYNSTSTQIAQMFSTGDLVLQNGGTFTNNNYRLQVNATGSNSGSLFLGGTTIATGSIARTMLISSSLSASANNDVLVGLDIQPTFTNGAFTGVTNTVLRVNGNITPTFAGNGNIGTGVLPFGAGVFSGIVYSNTYQNYSSNINFSIGGTTVARLWTTSNLTLQNGGTFTDSGYRLAINSSGSLSGSLYITGSSNQTLLRVDSDASSSILFVSGSGQVGIGTSTPSSTVLLDVSGVQSVGLRLVNPTSAPAGGWTNSPSIYLQGSIWNSALGSRTMAGSIVIAPATYPSPGFNINPPISKMSFLVGSDSSAPTERMFLNSDGKLGVVGGIVSNATTTSNTFNLTLDNSATATSGGTTWNSNKLVLKGRAWNSAQGSVNNMAYLMVSNITNNANPTVDKLSFFVGSANSTNAGDVDGNAIERFSLRTDGIATLSGSLNITGSSNSNLLRIDSPASSSILFVSGSGRVGINTSTPRATTELVGTLRLTNIGDPSKFNDLTTDLNGYMTIGNVVYTGGIGSNSGYVNLYQNYVNVGSASGYFFTSTVNSGTGTRDVGFSRAGVNIVSVNTGAEGNANGTLLAANVGVGLGMTSPSARLVARGSGATSATTTFLLQNSTPTNLLSVLDNGQVSFTSPTMSLAASQSAFSISPIISASNIVGGQYYGVNITPTFFQTTGSQTETAFRVAATFTSSNATSTSGSNIIADFGSTSAGSQLTVTDVTSGSIYMVNDVSGIPIIEATSNWDVNIYDFPNKVFEKTGSQVNIYGTMRVSGSFILPLSQSVAPQTGSAYWSGSLLFIYDGTRYRSSSFA